MIKRHAMTIHLSVEGWRISDHSIIQFIITRNELSSFCRSLLNSDIRIPGTLASMKLRLIVRDQSRIDDVSYRIDDPQHICKTSGSHTYPMVSSIERSILKMNIGRDIPSLRVRRLLEPFRQLYSVGEIQIKGAFPERYRAEIAAETRKTKLSIHHLCDNVLNAFPEAVTRLDVGDHRLSVLEFWDILKVIQYARRLDKGQSYDEITHGEYAGFTIRDAFEIIEFAASIRLAWACLKSGDWNYFHFYMIWIAPGSIDMNEQKWVHASNCGHEIGMLYFLHGCHTYGPSYPINDAIEALRRGLQLEPGNSLLEKELGKVQRKLARSKFRKSRPII